MGLEFSDTVFKLISFLGSSGFWLEFVCFLSNGFFCIAISFRGITEMSIAVILISGASLKVLCLFVSSEFLLFKV